MKLGERISGGAVRDCFEVEGHPDLCAKVQRNVAKRELFGIPFNLRMEVFLLLRFGEIDMNVRESRIVRELLGPIRNFLPETLQLDMDESGKTQLIVSRPQNYDGKYSQPLINHGALSDVNFWSDINKIADTMIRERIIGLDIFRGGQNLLVHEYGPGKYRPVLIDVKSVGHTVPMLKRPLLILESEQVKELESQLMTLKKRFYASPQAKQQDLKRVAMG